MAISIHPSGPPAGEQPKNAKSDQLGRLSTKAGPVGELPRRTRLDRRARLSNRPSYSSISPSASRSRTSRPAGQAAVGYGNSALGEHLVNGDLLPVPRVELVENPAFGGAVGVQESSCTTYQRPHSALNQFRPSTTSPPTSTCRSGGCLAPNAISTEPVQLLDRVSQVCLGSPCRNTRPDEIVEAPQVRS